LRTFALNLQIRFKVPCYCGHEFEAEHKGAAGGEFTEICEKCKSEYDFIVDDHGSVTVGAIRISDTAKDDRILTETCAVLGLDKRKVKVRNGLGKVNLNRFARVLMEKVSEIEVESQIFTGNAA
jgi:hypothetical protein